VEFGDWERFKDIKLDTPRARIYKWRKSLFGWTGTLQMPERMQLVETLHRKSSLKQAPFNLFQYQPN